MNTRNQPCECGSGKKAKKCCTAPQLISARHLGLRHLKLARLRYERTMQPARRNPYQPIFSAIGMAATLPTRLQGPGDRESTREMRSPLI